MKIIRLFILIFFICPKVYSETGTQELNLQIVNERVLSNNFRILENAQKVYQAKTEIQKARGMLLPSLTIWGLGRLFIDPSRILEGVEDIAPFVVPANWFRGEEIKILYLAESEAYRALVANELYSARALYFKICLDEFLLQKTLEAQKDLENFLPIVSDLVKLGAASANAIRDLENRILSLRKDAASLLLLIKTSTGQLSLSLGLDHADYQVKKINLEEFFQESPIQFSDFEFRVLSNSPERRQIDHFLTALPFVKKEVQYSFLGSSTISRGVAEGSFDKLPSPQGLGFGQGPMLRITDAEMTKLRIQKKAVEETLKRQLSLVILTYGLDLENYDFSKRRLQLSVASLEQNLFELKVPGSRKVSVLEVVESSRNVIQSQADLLSQQYRLLTGFDKLQRLVFEQEYQIYPESLQSLKEIK